MNAKDRIPPDDDFVPGDPGSTKPFVLKLAGGQLIQAGYANKPARGVLEVRFPTAFRGQPVVTITPSWRAEVGQIETLLGASSILFKCTSAQGAADYYVAWVAVGEAP